jgi:hypothetical protein
LCRDAFKVISDAGIPKIGQEAPVSGKPRRKNTLLGRQILIVHGITETLEWSNVQLLIVVVEDGSLEASVDLFSARSSEAVFTISLSPSHPNMILFVQ